jgi:site-specific recombinase XerD
MRTRVIHLINPKTDSLTTRPIYMNRALYSPLAGLLAVAAAIPRDQYEVAQQQISPWSINAAIAALRFFFTMTLERPDLVRPLRIVTEPRRAPVVLSQEEVARLLEAAPGLKYKAALSVAYGAGLRVSGMIS